MISPRQVALFGYGGTNAYFPAVWFAEADDSHLTDQERQQGGIGHGSKGGKKKRWIERDGKILVFESSDQVETFIQSEAIEELPKQKKIKRKEVVNTEPVAVIDKVELKKLSTVYQYRQQLYYADQIGDISRIIAIYKELQRREEDEIECLMLIM